MARRASASVVHEHVQHFFEISRAPVWNILAESQLRALVDLVRGPGQVGEHAQEQAAHPQHGHVEQQQEKESDRRHQDAGQPDQLAHPRQRQGLPDRLVPAAGVAVTGVESDKVTNQ
jgi:hypothetical protein